MGDHRVNLDPVVHDNADDFRYVSAALGAAQRQYPKVAARHQLKRATCDFLAHLNHTDDD